MSSTYTFDLTPPRRPSLDDLGGAAKQDDAKYPPNPVTMMNATNWNFFARFFEGIGKVVPFCTIHVAFSAGAPYIVSLQSMRASLVSGNLVLTDNGAGDTTISWAGIATSFPPANRPPRADIVGDGSFLAPTCDTSTANTVRVRTRDNTNTLVDQAFVVEIY